MPLTGDGIPLTYVGHACVLFELSRLRVLTDPVLRGRIGHLRRVAPPADPDATADVDLILISHAHHDHLDVPSLRSLPTATPALCAPPAAAAVARAGLEPVVLRPGETWRRDSLSVSATPAEHDGRRWPHVGDGEAVGFLAGGPAGSVYFAGDTGEFDEMGALGPVDVALLPVAGWGPKLGPGHLDPEAAARAAVAVRARVALPIHWGSYGPITQRPRAPADRPAREFVAALAGIAPDVVSEVVPVGGSVTIEGLRGSGPPLVRSSGG